VHETTGSVGEQPAPPPVGKKAGDPAGERRAKPDDCQPPRAVGFGPHRPHLPDFAGRNALFSGGVGRREAGYL